MAKSEQMVVQDAFEPRLARTTTSEVWRRRRLDWLPRTPIPMEMRVSPVHDRHIISCSSPQGRPTVMPRRGGSLLPYTAVPMMNLPFADRPDIVRICTPNRYPTSANNSRIQSALDPRLSVPAQKQIVNNRPDMVRIASPDQAHVKGIFHPRVRIGELPIPSVPVHHSGSPAPPNTLPS